MGATRSIAKNTFLLTLGLMSGRVMALFLRKKMMSILDVGDMGIWFTAIGLTAILQVVTNYGLGTLLTREVTKARGMTLPLFWSTLRIRWILGGFCYLFLLGFVSVSGYEPLARSAVLLMGLAIFFEATNMACDSVLQAHEKVQYQSLGQIGSTVVYLVLAWIWLDAGHGLMGVVWANLISRVGRFTIMAPLMFARTGPWRWRDPDGAPAPGMRDLWRLGLPLCLATTFGIIYNYIDTVMLKSMIGNAAAGVYGTGHQALDVSLMLPSLFGTALFPAMARYGMDTADDVRRLGERALRFMLIVVIPVTLFMSFTAEPIIGWFSKKAEFSDSVSVMIVIIWGLPLQAANIIFNRLLITAEREKVFIVIGLVSMLSNIALNVYLIPRYSYYGAASATLISLSVSFVLHLRFLWGTRYRPPLLRPILGPAGALAVAWLAVSLGFRFAIPSWHVGWLALPVDQGWSPFLIVAGTTAILYLLSLFGLRVLRRDDVVLLRELFRF